MKDTVPMYYQQMSRDIATREQALREVRCLLFAEARAGCDRARRILWAIATMRQWTEAEIARENVRRAGVQ